MHYTSLPFGVIFSQALSPIQGSFKQRETQYMIHMILPSMKLNIQVWCIEVWCIGRSSPSKNYSQQNTLVHYKEYFYMRVKLSRTKNVLTYI